jgi:hypothetical protein
MSYLASSMPYLQMFYDLLTSGHRLVSSPLTHGPLGDKYPKYNNQKCIYSVSFFSLMNYTSVPFILQKNSNTLSLIIAY